MLFFLSPFILSFFVFMLSLELYVDVPLLFACLVIADHVVQYCTGLATIAYKYTIQSEAKTKKDANSCYVTACGCRGAYTSKNEERLNEGPRLQ